MVKVNVIGFLGADATQKDINGKSSIGFNICDTENWTDKNGVKQSKSTWYTDKFGILPFLKKGTQVYVECNGINANGYAGKDGQILASINLKVQSIQLLGNKPVNEAVGGKTSDVDNNIEPPF